MSSYNQSICRIVSDYLAESAQSQAVIADALGVTTTAANRKLTGARQWSVADLQNLNKAFGLEFPLPALAGAK